MSPDDEDLSALIRTQATRHSAPDALRAGIRTQLALADAGRLPLQEPLSPSPPRVRWFNRLGWGSASLGFAAGMLCTVLMLPLVQRLDLNEPLEAELVADHVRALQVGPVVEVASTDRHTVKPWFQGRLDYAPPVVDLAAQGYPLMGARIEHVRGDVVATLAYARKRHVIDVFVWPSAEQRPAARTLRKGFNVMHWADGSMQYWAVSDLERSEIESFVQLWQAHAAAQ